MSLDPYREIDTFIQSGRLRQAAAALKKRASGEADSWKFYFWFGRLNERLGLVPAAKKKFQQALRLNPNSAFLHKELANLLESSGLHAEAERLRLRGVVLDGSSAESLLALARLHAKMGALRKAKSEFLQAAERAPRSVRPYFELSELLEMSGNFDAAERIARKARRKVRGDRAFLSEEDSFRALMRTGCYREAFTRAETMLDAGPPSRQVAHFHQPWKETVPSRIWLARRLRLRPLLRSGHSGVWASFYSGIAESYMGNLKRAIGHLDPLSQLDGARYGWMRYWLGLVKLRSGRYQEAIVEFEASSRSEPRHWPQAAFLAEAHLCLGNERKSFRVLNEAESAAAAAGERADWAAWRRALLLWAGRYQEAAAGGKGEMEEGLRYGYCWRGAALFLLGRTSRARADLDRAIILRPIDAEALIWRGELNRLAGRHEEALLDFERAIAATPGVCLWAYFNRALIWAVKGKKSAMRSDFRRIPQEIIERIVAASSFSWPETDTEIEETLRAGLKLARGVRRFEPYVQAVWMGRLSRSPQSAADNSLLPALDP